jgi:propanediol utilization protein
MDINDKLLAREPHPNRCGRPPLRASVAVSSSHVHLTAAAIETLFCDHYSLHALRLLGQPELYEADETVTVIGPGGRLNHISIIGPPGLENQLEVSSTDARILGIAVPSRNFHQSAVTPEVVIQGPRARIRLEASLIWPLRHVCMSPTEAESAGVHEGDQIGAVIRMHQRVVILRDVQVRVSSTCRSELRLDLDEAHRLNLKSGQRVEISAIAPAQTRTAGVHEAEIQVTAPPGQAHSSTETSDALGVGSTSLY